MTSTRVAQIGRFFARRWRGQVSQSVLFWRDMLVVGTLVNLVATFAALMAAAQGAPIMAAAALHFAPLPYNLFLVASLRRVPGRTAVFSVVALVWLVIMTLV